MTDATAPQASNDPAEEATDQTLEQGAVQADPVAGAEAAPSGEGAPGGVTLEPHGQWGRPAEGDAPAAEGDGEEAGSETPAEKPAPEPPPARVRDLPFGFLAEGGSIWQEDGPHYHGRKVAELADDAADPARVDAKVEELQAAFAALRTEVDALLAEAKAAPNLSSFLGRTRRMKGTAGRTDALGDFNALFEELRGFEKEIQAQIEERKGKKEAIIARAEELADSTQWKATGDALRAAFDEWKTIGSAGRDNDDTLWKRFTAARETFNTRRAAHFAEMKEGWEEAKTRKEALIAQAAELSESEDWRGTSLAMRGLMDEWKKAGTAGREQDDALWTAFRAAQQGFYDRRAAFWASNAAAKEALVARAAEIAASGADDVPDQFRNLMTDWKAVGTAGNRDADDQLWNSFRAAQQAWFDGRNARAAEQRAEGESRLLEQKEALVQQAEALLASSDSAAAARARELQEQWRALGPTRGDRADALWRRFRRALDAQTAAPMTDPSRPSGAWETTLRDALSRSKAEIDELRWTIGKDEEHLARLEKELGSAATEALRDLEVRVAELRAKLTRNRSEAQRLEESMNEIEESLRGE